MLTGGYSLEACTFIQGSIQVIIQLIQVSINWSQRHILSVSDRGYYVWQ